MIWIAASLTVSAFDTRDKITSYNWELKRNYTYDIDKLYARMVFHWLAYSLFTYCMINNLFGHYQYRFDANDYWKIFLGYVFF